MAMKPDISLQRLGRLADQWTTEATHPLMPGVVVHGTADIEWLEGEQFLIQRTRNDHPDFPDAIAVIGFTDRDRVGAAESAEAVEGAEHQLTMHYFDSRGVSRVYQASIDDEAWRLSRPSPGFAQRFTGKLTDGGNTIDGLWQLCEDDVHWKDDLRITYRRKARR